MSISNTLDRLHFDVKKNRWLRYFAVFCRVALAAGFIPAGMVKIMGERFTSLSVNHPMGHYLEALSLTGFYYPFIGYVQVIAAILLLIPRTATLGAILYFPIILNICILSLAVRFEGSLITSPLMVLANLYLLAWDYDKFKLIFWFHRQAIPAKPITVSNKFPVAFFAGVIAVMVVVVLLVTNVFNIMPRNTLGECKQQCTNSKNPNACNTFCDCIHTKGEPLNKALAAYENALNK